MESVYLIAGLLLVALTLVDFLWTTLWIDGGAGPVTDRVTTLLWKLLKKASSNGSKLLNLSGPLLITVTLAVWMLLLWTGWALIFAGNEVTFIDTMDNEPISWTERFYYAGYLIFTLGNGDYTPKQGIWQIMSVIATGTGMMLITLAVTYVLSVVGAATQQRSLADSISGIGKSGAEVVKNTWNGRDFHDIDLLLNTFSSQLSTLADQYKAYPVLHYYYSHRQTKALAVGVAVIDDALTVFRYGLSSDRQPNNLLMQELRSSVDRFMETLQSFGTKQTEEVPPLPDLSYLRELGVPVVSDSEFEQAAADLADRRNTLLNIVRADAREWPSGDQ